jgi:exonuclease SbcC
MRRLEAALVRVRGRMERLQPIAAQVPCWLPAVAEREQRCARLQQRRAPLEHAYTRTTESLRILEDHARRYRELHQRIAPLNDTLQRFLRELQTVHELSPRPTR